MREIILHTSVNVQKRTSWRGIARNVYNIMKSQRLNMLTMWSTLVYGGRWSRTSTPYGTSTNISTSSIMLLYRHTFQVRWLVDGIWIVKNDSGQCYLSSHQGEKRKKNLAADFYVYFMNALEIVFGELKYQNEKPTRGQRELNIIVLSLSAELFWCPNSYCSQRHFESW